MHLGNGAITPECAILTASVAAAGLGFAAASARQVPFSPSRLLAAGAWGGAIFAAQMLNVPVLPYSSGHLVGGVLLAVALGPGLGAVTMAVVLALQTLLLGDGGLAALGANIVNMALVPAAIVAASRAWQSHAKSRWQAGLHAGALAAVAVLLAAGLIVLEVALARSGLQELPLASFATSMLLVHTVIALAEGAVTGAIVLAAYPVLTERTETSERRLAAGVAALAVVLLALAPLASGLPDGYEASAQESAWPSLLSEAPAELPGELNASLAMSQGRLTGALSATLTNEFTLAAGATAATALACAALAWACSRRPGAVG